ncbi:MAG TPA: hypothetical protein EYH05_13190 [Anaerolineae bacterium]|nr:hypothetical protein [Anaerolineae bacterium]
MFDYDTEINLEQELSEIPPEYQDAFRQTIEQELTDTEQNRTDTDILTYLRGRRDDFKRGSFIRPDGRPGMVALNPDTMYEQALPELAQSSMGEPDNTAERRRTLIKVGIFVGVILVFLFFVFRGRAQRVGEQEVVAEGTPTAEVSGEGTPVPTPPLPEITGVDDSLQTIGSLGGALTIGRPSAIELHYGRTEETIALAIDPSKSTPKGELRYNETTMLSDNPVAVWLFGTVLNYAIGIPDSMVRNLEPGDRITLSTDTGASLRFVVAETGQVANYEAGRLLSQNRLGLTLFALPAIAEDDVSFAIANYDIASEEDRRQIAYEVGDNFALNAGGELQISAVQFSHTVDGAIRIVINGTTNNLNDSQSIMLSLTSSNEQTTAVQLTPDDDGDWQASFTMPDSTTGLSHSAGSGQALFAEFRVLPGGNPAIVQLGEAPRLTEQLEVEIAGAWWDVERGQVVIAVSVHNPGEGAVYLGPEFIQLATEGGDANEIAGQITPRLPILIDSGETTGITVSFLPQDTPVQLQVDADLWEVAGIPLE